MADFNIDRLFAGRTMALDRAALPALASRAALRIGDASLEQLERRAGLLDGRENGVPVTRIGKTAIVPLVGVITRDPLDIWLFGGTNPDAFLRTVQQAIADPDMADIVVLTDSPGGEVALVMEVAAALRELRNRKPITSIARTLMASAAYWIAAQATVIVASPSAQIGSVGVFVCHAEQSRLLDRVGITVTYITSDAKKVEANSEEPLADDARAFIKAEVDRVYGQFVADLALGRNTSEARIRRDFGSGRAFGAEEAKRRGMVDRIETLDATIGRLAAGNGRGSMAIRGQHAIDEEHLAIVAALTGDTAPACRDRDQAAADRDAIAIAAALAD